MHSSSECSLISSFRKFSNFNSCQILGKPISSYFNSNLIWKSWKNSSCPSLPVLILMPDRVQTRKHY